MAQQKAKVRVKLDTSQAKAQLQGLTKEGEVTAGRISDKLSKGSSISGNFSKGAALGAGLSLGAGALKSAGSSLRSGFGDVFSEGLSGFGADLAGAIGTPDARAARSAREETQNIFGASVGRTGSLTDATNYYNSVKKFKEQEEVGKNRIKSELGGVGRGNNKGKDSEGFVGSIVDPVVGAIRDGFQGIVDLLGV